MNQQNKSEGTTPQAERQELLALRKKFKDEHMLNKQDSDRSEELIEIVCGRAVAPVETPQLTEIKPVGSHIIDHPDLKRWLEQEPRYAEQLIHNYVRLAVNPHLHAEIVEVAEAYERAQNAGLREEIERLKEGERLVRDFLERDYGVSEITTICSRYDDAEQELTELRAKLAEQERHVCASLGIDGNAEDGYEVIAEPPIGAETFAEAVSEFVQFNNRQIEAAEAEAAALRERERWIPVEEKLPEKQVMVMVSNPAWPAGSPIMMMGHIDGLGKWCGHYTDTKHCGWGSNQPWAMADPTHWKALSAAPERGKDGES